MKFSIGIPAYKATYLRECIDSILSQTYINFELIILNDASPENVDEIVTFYTDSRIRYYVNEINIGAENVVDNWNRILELSKGEYIVMMGDDDMLMPRYFEEFNNLINKYPFLSIYHCRAKEIDENSRFRTILYNYPERESVYDLMLNRLVRGRATFISDFVYKVSDLRNNGGFYKLPLAWASDDVTSFIAASKDGIAHTNSCIFCYRRHPTSITSSGSVLMKLQAIQLEKNWYKDFLDGCEPIGDEEEMVVKVLKRSWSNIIVKRQALAVGQVSRGRIIGVIFNVIRKRKKLNVRFKTIVYGLFIFIKQTAYGRYL